MRKKFNLLSLTLFFLFSLVTLTVQAAGPYQVVDPGFEDWSQSFNSKPALGGGSTGANTGKGLWYGSNVFKSVMGIDVWGQVVYQTTEAHSGKYAAKLMDTEVGAAGIKETSPSWVTLGTPWAYLDGIDTGSATAGTDGGVPFTARPDAMAVWVKRVSNGKENINLVFYSWKGTAKADSYKNKNGGCTTTSHTDEESDIRMGADPNICGTDVEAVQIAEAHFQTKEQYKDWTRIEVPIRYLKDELPEKMNIILSASTYPEGRATEPLFAGNYMLVDDLELIYKSTVDELRLNNEPLYGFKSEIHDYTVALGENATDKDIPTISCKRSGRSLSGSEITIVQATKLYEPATITVRAEDGSSTTTYTVTFVRTQSLNSRAESISVNGQPIANFSGYVTEYNVTLPYGTTEAPVITVQKAEDVQTVKVETCNNFPCVAKVTVTAENVSYSTTYNINFGLGQLTDNTLQDILINGKSIAGFDPATNVYVVEMPLGTTEDPVIEPVSKYAPGEQNIVVTNNGLNGKSTIVVTPPSGAARTYRISYVITESSYSYLNDILLDGVSLEGFDPATMQYNVALPVGTTTLPAITWEQGDDYQNVALASEGVNGTSRITVTAQNGNVSIYRLVFSVEKSTNHTLNNIFVDGVALDGFDPAVTEYSFNVDPMATSRPVVTWEAGDAYQTVTKNPASEATVAIEGVTKLTVRAQNGATTVYNITFTQKLSDNAKLDDLQVEGYALSPVFNSNQTAYTCALQRGTTTVPTITYVKGDAAQTVRIDENGVNGVAKITVKAQTGATMVYTIAFSVVTSSDVTLKDILVGGESIADFNPATLQYNITLPAGTTALPAIEPVKNDDAQRIIMNKGGVNGTTTIKVVAENGAEQTYSLVFEVEKSLNATLKNIFVGNVALPDFDPNVLDYRYVLPVDATECPIVEAEGYPGQTITITMPQLLGTARIEVQPEEGAKNVYTVQFVYQMSDNVLLNDIMVDGVSVDGFDPMVNSYQINLPEGTTTVPTITYVKADPAQTVQVISGGLNATTQVVVKAEDGSVNTYTVVLNVAKSDNALLDAILVDGVLLDGFAAGTFTYTYTLPVGTTVLPSVTYQKGNNGQQVTTILPQLEGNATLQVTSEDASQTNTYTVTFAVAPRTDATLKDILLDGVSLAGFDSQVTAYTIDVKNGESAPAITYQKQDASQQVIVNNQGLLGCTLAVTAQSGATTTYSIAYNVVSNGNALLKDIQLYNAQALSFASIDGFDANIHQYDITLPWRTAALPVINPVAATKGQVITLTEGGVNGTTTIRVLADDGVTEATYQLNFAVEQSSDATLSNIIVGGNDVTGFTPNQFHYVVTLPYGTTEVPAIEYENATQNGVAITEQQVVLTQAGLKGTTTLQVTSQDGTVTNTYTLHFAVAESGKENKLTRLVVGTTLVPLQDGVYDYTITLPYGTTELPELSGEKNYDEQEIRLVKKADSYQVNVISNQQGVADVVYNISCKVASSPVALTGITLKNDAKLYPAFDPAITQYVALVNESSDIDVTFDENINKITVLADQSNKRQVRITSLNDATQSIDYAIYLHYVNDVIPNAEFTNWTKATHNDADKPVGWNVLADVVASKKVTAMGTYTTGQEVQKGDGVVKLSTRNSSKTLGGIIPGFTTLGNVSATLASAAGSTTGVSGGITFRNTPDEFSYRYNFVKNTNTGVNTNTHVYCQLSDGSATPVTAEHTEVTVKDEWKIGKKPLVYPANYAPKTLNIVLNSAKTENANGFKTGIWGLDTNVELALMYVDYVRLTYNSAITTVKVDGVAATKNGNTFNASIATEYVGLPKLVVTGEVEDQAYEFFWGEEVNGVRNVTIRSYAEDATYTDYTLILTRDLSAENTLQDLVVEGATAMVFDPATLQYTFAVPTSERQLPNVMATPKSSHATVTFVGENNLAAWVQEGEEEDASSLSIIVTSETGEAKEYKLVIEVEKQSDATLKNLSVEGYDIAYDPATLAYTVTLPAGTTALPAVNFEKQSDAQTVEVALAATTTIDVTAEDGVTTQTYQITFVTEATVGTANLTLLAVNNAEPLTPSFASDVMDYTTTLVNDEPAAVIYVKETATDAFVMQLTDQASTLSLDNLNGTQNQYQVVYTQDPSNNALLQNILVNGVGVENFDAATLEYEVTRLPGQVIDLEPVLAEEGQTMTIAYDEATQIYTIVVTAEDAQTTQTYTVALVAPINNNADLAGILVDGNMIDGFDKNVTEYTYVIPSETPKWQEPSMPTLQAVAGSEGQTIVIEVNGINEKTYITVTAQDGKTQKVYEVNFVAQPSDNAYLASIAANYEVLPDFAYDKFVYEVKVAVSEDRPVITYQKGDGFQQVVEVEETDKLLLEVTAQAGNKETYEINFVTVYTGNAQLAGITLDGEMMADFASDTYEYNVELPVGTTILPAIGVISGADGQTTQIVTNGVNGDAIITVTADDATTTQEYVIHFTVKLSEVATLLDIQVDGESLSDFAADKFDYTVTYPVGTRQWPVVTWTAGDAYQSVVATEEVLDTWNKVVTIVTTAQDNIHSQTYTVNLKVEKSANNALKAIYFDGDEYETFTAEQLTYTVELPIGTTTYPEVTYTEGDAYQMVNKSVVDNVVTLEVVAENGDVRTYTIEFIILHSSNASLSGIYVDYELIDGFDPARLEYDYVLPYGTTEMPEVSYEAGDNWQTIATNSGGIRGNYTIHVVAEDGINEQTYIIHFSVAKSTNALLQDILVDGVSLPNFDSEVFTYNVALPYGETVVPTIEGVAAMETQIIDEVQAASVAEKSTITVTAEDGITQKVYEITWYNQESSNAKLEMIYLDGEPLAEFDKNVSDYTVTLPYGTTALPEVTWTNGDADQTAELTMDGMIATITVEAQDGTPGEYILYFVIEKSSENRLKNIYINGEPLQDFDPEVVEYAIEYPAGTPVAEVPTLEDITYDVFDPIETVTLMNDGMVLMLRVMAENGNIRTYVIAQSIALSTNSYLEDILINGESLPAFSPEQLEYTYILPFGSSAVPEDIVYVSNDTTQTVVLSINQLGMPTEIFVTAEDGSKSVYRIHFMVDEFDPTTTPEADNVCITSLPDGSWKFTTNCTNVVLYLVTLDGKVLLTAPLELVDPNVPNICSDEAEGFVYDAAIDNVIAYYFVHNMKTVISSGKFRVSHQ